MRYENKGQIKNYLLRSSFVTFIEKTNNIQFNGVTLEGCELKVNDIIFNEIINVCRTLEINYYVV